MTRPGQALHAHLAQPLVAEPDPARLARTRLTPQAAFFVRNHGDIPRLEPAAHRLRVEGRVATPLDLSLAELNARLPERRVTAALQCAGNRRGELWALERTAGDPWGPGAIGNAEWTGVSLADLLRAAGVEEAAPLHVEFTGADSCGPEAERFAVSIPLAKAMAPETLLAHAMNGEPLTPEHGHPLRAVVPGFAGIRSAKWLTRIAVRDTPSEGRYQARDYKLFPPEVREETADWSKGTPIEAMPLNSAILDPAQGATLPAGPVTLRGWAIAPPGARVTGVEVSPDGGRTWQAAQLDPDPASPWAWTRWHATLDLPPGAHELAVRARDEAGRTQPERLDEAWNWKGYLNAAWHRVPIRAA